MDQTSSPTALAPNYAPASKGTMLRQMVRVFMQNKLAVASLIYIVLLTIACIVIPLFYKTSFTAYNNFSNNSCYDSSTLGYSGPSLHHLLGCSSSGFDELGLIMFAGRYSLLIGYLSAIVTMTFGVAYGIFAGFRGGWIDAIMMRIDDMLLSIPGLYLLLLIITIWGRSTLGLIIVIGATGWFGVARLMRGEALQLRNREYSQAVRVMGGSGSRIMMKHILPNAISTMVTTATFALGDSILALSGLGFLGFGLQAPAIDWGTMIQNAIDTFENGSWWTLWPLAIVFILLVLSTNYIGDALRDAFEVRLQER